MKEKIIPWIASVKELLHLTKPSHLEWDFHLIRIALNYLVFRAWPLILLGLLLMALAYTTILTTHQTRQLISAKNEEIATGDKLEVEWRHLIIEERVYSEHSRIQAIAEERLNMKLPDASQERIIEIDDATSSYSSE